MRRRLPVIKRHFQLADRQLTSTEPPTQILENPTICKTLLELRKAHQAASACGRDPWDFAIRISQLFRCGISTEVLRTLIGRMWITHMQRIPDHVNLPEFQAESRLIFSDRTCFVLTVQGLEVADKLAAPGMCFTNQPKNPSTITPPAARYPTPCWDRQRRELRMGDVLVKRFRWPAENQLVPRSLLKAPLPCWSKAPQKKLSSESVVVLPKIEIQ